MIQTGRFSQNASVILACRYIKKKNHKNVVTHNMEIISINSRQTIILSANLTSTIYGSMSSILLAKINISFMWQIKYVSISGFVVVVHKHFLLFHRAPETIDLVIDWHVMHGNRSDQFHNTRCKCCVDSNPLKYSIYQCDAFDIMTATVNSFLSEIDIAKRLEVFLTFRNFAIQLYSIFREFPTNSEHLNCKLVCHPTQPVKPINFSSLHNSNHVTCSNVTKTQILSSDSYTTRANNLYRLKYSFGRFSIHSCYFERIFWLKITFNAR